MRNLLTRSLTGAIFVSLLLGSILWNELAATCVLGVFFVLGVIEFYSLFDSHEHIRLKKWINISSAFLVFALLLLALNKLIPEIFAPQFSGIHQKNKRYRCEPKNLWDKFI